MEIRQIKYFVAVIDCGSLSSAARQVHVAQSALSKQMSALEDDLGLRSAAAPTLSAVRLPWRCRKASPPSWPCR